jgi:hypothetical protein
MIALLITLLAVAPHAMTDQNPVVPEGTLITSAQVTGFDISRLSPGLREEIRNLAGTPLHQQRLDELAARIEAERPRHVAAGRSVMDPDGRARVFFVVGRKELPEQDDNVNTQYVVENARIVGVPDAEVTQALVDALEALVGKRLDSTDAQRVQEQIESELPRYEIDRRIQRGSRPGQIKLIYEAHKREPPKWLRFDSLRSNAIFHSEQGWGSYLDLGIGNGAVRFTPIVAIDNADDLVEEYTGYGLRFETRQLGTRRLGASLEWSWFEQDWRDATLGAVALNPDIPPLYENRTTITPLVKFALSPNLSVSGGVSISELEPLTPGAGSQTANAAVGSLDYHLRWDDASDATHTINANFGVRAGSRELDSDLAYTRYFGEGSYRYDAGRHHVQAAGMAGGVTGRAPLFERFALGDSMTLRGWDKYDIAPAGGNRMVYSSLEYRYTGLALFLDVGSVWDANAERHVRVSTGFGFHGGPAFLAVGFPLNTDNVKAIVTIGLRISGIGTRW